MRGGGILVDVPGPGPVRVTVASVEAFLQHKVTPRPAVEMMQISHSMYQGLNLQLQHKARLIDELSQRLLTWEGAEAAHAAEVQRLEEERVAAERALEVEREEAAAKLEAERARAAETLAAAKAAAEQRLEKHLEEQRTQFTAEALAAIAEERAKAQAAEAELEAERARGFWSRLFGR
jgi:cell division septum initiation protein DivIVA